MNNIISAAVLTDFLHWLHENEKSVATIDKYLRDARRFAQFLGTRALDKEKVIAYKHYLCEQGYALRSINSMLASVNSLLSFLNRGDCRVQLLRAQRSVYCSTERELTKEEYLRLLDAACGNTRLHLLLQTICATGIRISELRYFTIEAVRAGEIVAACKSKTRTILLPQKLRKRLLRYAHVCGIKNGAVFCTRSGRPIDRSNIWKAMKALCAAAKVMPSKVFPHNLRKLFARTFYKIDKDVVKLADVLGHSSVNTTRIYLISSGAEHRRMLERLHLLA